MLDEKPTNKNISIIGVILIIVVLSIGAIGIILLSPPVGKTENTSSESNRILTTSFTNITVGDAFELINKSKNINIIDDPTHCHCRYDDEHIGDPPRFEAIKISDLKALPKSIRTLYNTTNDTIVYDDDGKGEGIVHCKTLINHTYGAIYYLEGGLNAWKKENYPVIGK